MVTTRPKVRERQNQILEKLTREGSVRVTQLSQELDATVFQHLGCHIRQLIDNDPGNKR